VLTTLVGAYIGNLQDFYCRVLYEWRGCFLSTVDVHQINYKLNTTSPISCRLTIRHAVYLVIVNENTLPNIVTPLAFHIKIICL
jgi:hypothetical protein